MSIERKHWAIWVVLSFVLCLINQTSGNAEEKTSQQKLSRHEFLQIRMGIPINIIVYAADEPTANVAVKAAYERFRQLDRIMSDYDPDSELMQLCTQAKPGIAYPVSPELFHVLSASQALSQKTDGAFDVTVGPVVKLWRIARRRKVLPEPHRLQQALSQVGYQKIILTGCQASASPTQQTVTLAESGMRIDLGAIAKGYAADEALRVLKEHGLPISLIDAGGDVVAGDPPPDADAWRIEVEKLKNAQTDTAQPFVVELKNAAIATSGDAYQFVEIDGTRYSHIINPNTGLSLTTPSSVSVIAPSGLLADSLASAVSVLGPEKGMTLIEETPSTEALIVQRHREDQKQTYTSTGFPKQSQ